MTVRLRALGLAALLAAASSHSAAAQAEPRRPALAAGADSNDARAYYRLGVGRLAGDPPPGADAVWGASGLEPKGAAPLSARRAALLMANRSMLLGYFSGTET